VEDQRWTLARIATVIARRFHVRFSPAQTWRILRQMAGVCRSPSAGRVALGINGVPFMVFNGTHAVAGATCIEGYTAAITRAAEEAGLSRN
jgi:hypothetical protein